jgi:hypothetical protein
MSDMLAATEICPPPFAEFLENGVFGNSLFEHAFQSRPWK